MRVSFLEDPNGGLIGSDFCTEKFQLFDALTEDWGAETTIDFK
jgi:hypothetical protein